MSRFVLSLLLFATALAAVAPATAAGLRVAFVVSENFNMIDLAGPWEVFQDTHLPSDDGAMRMPDVYTVSTRTSPVHSTGGMVVMPSYTLDKAPAPDIVVIGAQRDGSPELLEWLEAQHARGATVMSICTGASKLAAAGLLDGRRATTHHDFIAGFRERFGKVEWVESRRFVRAGERLYTAGGLTSGIDLALHVVAERFGADTARATAAYMEYESDGWTRAAD